MLRQNPHPPHAHGLSRRELLQAGLAAGVTVSAWPLAGPLWSQEAGPPRRGGILRVRGWDPVHFDPHLTRNFKTHTALSFVYSKLLRHKAGPDVKPGTFIVEPDLAERWEGPDDTTYIFHLRKGVTWHNQPPVNGRELVAEAGYPKGFKTQLHATGGCGPDMVDAAQLAQRYLKDVGMEAELKLQEYGAYMATTFMGKYEGMAMGPVSIAWEPDSVLYGLYAPDQPRNSGHVNDPKLTAMLKEQRRTKDQEARKQLIFDIQRYAAEQQYYVYTLSPMLTGSWQPYVKNFAPNHSFDYGNRAAALWLDR